MRERHEAVVIVALGAVLVAGSTSSSASAKPTLVFPDRPDEDAVAPAMTTFKLRSSLDDLAVRPDGTIAVATQTNSNEARPTATVVRFGPLAQLPTLRLFGPNPAAATTQAAITATGGVVAWTMDGKGSPVTVGETSDDGIAAAPQQLSTPGLSAWPHDTASGGGATAVLYSEGKPATEGLGALQLAYRAPGAVTFASTQVPIRSRLRDFWESKLVVGPSGDGAIAVWSNERHAASLWRVRRDGTVSPELPIALKSKGWIDVKVAVGADGTIAAAFGMHDDRRADQVVLAQMPAGSSTSAALSRVKASAGSSLATQDMGLAVSPNGRLLFSIEDAGGAQVIVEGSGKALRTISTPYTAGSPTATAWLPDGTAVVVFETEAGIACEDRQLVSLRREAGTEVWKTRLIGPAITPAAKPSKSTGPRRPSGTAWVRNLSLVPAADGSAALAWEVWPDRGRVSAAVARVTP
jgi:hypothetical protein